MRRDPRTLALALALAFAPACSVLFDPAQYATEDAAATGIDAWSPDDPDAPAPPEPDAFVPEGVDADLDAHRPPPDVFEPPDASEPPDAFEPPDAGPPVFCPSSLTSLQLPRCMDATRLAYCSPETGDTLAISSAGAISLLGERTMGHRIGVLGNGVDVTGPVTVGSITDYEIGRTGDMVSVVWSHDAEVLRRDWTAGDATIDTAVAYDVGSLGASAVLDVSDASLDEIGIAYTTGGRGAVARCDGTGVRTCTSAPLALVPTSPTAWVARTSLGLVAAWPDPSRPAIHAELVGTSRNASTNVGSAADLTHVEGLRGTHTSVFYTLSDIEERAFPITDTGVSFFSLNGMARLAESDAAENAVIGHATVESGMLTIGTSYLRCVGTGCSCDSGCGTTVSEVEIPIDYPLLDWSLHTVGMYYRVAVLLVGDDDGTNVLVAMWSVLPPLPATPVVVMIGSGRTVGGVGHAVRAVATRHPMGNSLDVFAATLVTGGGSDQIYLSGLRLLDCGSAI